MRRTHRASASNRLPHDTTSLASRTRVICRCTSTAVLAAFLALGAPVASFAADNDDNSGQLNLNPDVLVNDTVGAGSTGDFAIRGRLFSAELTDRVQGQAEAMSARLAIADRLTFAHPDTSADEFQNVRAGLFEDYHVQALPARRGERETSPVRYGAILAVGAPIVLAGGVVAGRAWADRKKIAG